MILSSWNIRLFFVAVSMTGNFILCLISVLYSLTSSSERYAVWRIGSGLFGNFSISVLCSCLGIIIPEGDMSFSSSKSSVILLIFANKISCSPMSWLVLCSFFIDCCSVVSL